MLAQMLRPKAVTLYQAAHMPTLDTVLHISSVSTLLQTSLPPTHTFLFPRWSVTLQVSIAAAVALRASSSRERASSTHTINKASPIEGYRLDAWKNNLIQNTDKKHAKGDGGGGRGGETPD